MIYSKSAEYAIQAMIYLAEKASPDPVMIREIAEAYNIPRQFLAKLVQTLVKQRLLIAVRGRKGGVKLGKSASEIFLPDIIRAIDGLPPEKVPCVFGLDYCSDDQPCPLHHKWEMITNQIDDMLKSENLENLARRVAEKHEAMRDSGFSDIIGESIKP
ncbi:MAG: Rrf2 family transcriptional regulator [Candidatus Marinimicrobia bacterium]|nr:Rrf2 family transcriptional regulator [Candidatus Neomarinimicrobiota bacterium]